MNAGAPWSVKGIDPKAREVAKDHARRSGMTLGEWLNRVILEDDLPEDLTVESQFAVRRPGQDPPRLTAVPTSSEFTRVAFALDRLTDRIEASETRTGLAINGVEHSVRQALSRIDTAEREQHAAAARLEGLLAESNAEQSYFGERLRRLEADVGPRSAEALRILEQRVARAEPDVVAEGVLARLTERLAIAEARTAEALEDLKRSLVACDTRLSAVEGGGSGPQAELKFEALAEVLTHRVEAVRAEVAAQLQAAAGPQVEARLAAMAEHIQAAERRSAKAVEDIGRQVLNMAEAVSRKLGEVDQRGADAIDQVGTEVARIAGAVELRLARAEHAQAEAFERLGAELARVTGALDERLAVSETRAAEAFDDVGAEVARVAERVAAQAAELVAPPEPAAQALGPPPEPEPEMSAAPFGPELFSRAEVETGAAISPAAEPPPAAAPERVTVEAPWRRLELDVPDTDIPEIFAPLDEDEDLFEASRSAPSAGPQLSTREVIDRARAAARATAPEQPIQMRAKVEGRAATGRFFQGFGARPARPSRRANTAMQTALMVAGGAAFLSVGAAGLTLMQGPAAPRTVADASEPSPFPAAPRAAMALAPGLGGESSRLTPSVFARVKADVETGSPGALARLKALADAGDAGAQLYLAQLYDGGEAGLPRDIAEARRLTALSAEAGDAQAMHNLGVYFFRGEGGAQDLASAAQWFRKAAAAGVVESQYNLGLLYQSGSGVRRDLAQARHWFGQAARRGDAEAKQALAELSPRPGARSTPPRKPASAPAAASAGASQNVRQTQLILSRLGYYEGPADGLSSPAYRTALAEYQRDLDDQTAGPRPYAAAQR